MKNEQANLSMIFIPFDGGLLLKTTNQFDKNWGEQSLKILASHAIGITGV